MYQDEPQIMYEVARRLVTRGISVIPTGGSIGPRAKEPHHQALKATGHGYVNERGEERSTWREMQRRLPTEDELRGWYLGQGARGVGFVTGALSRWVVIDVDPEGLGLLGALGWEPHVWTPSGGAHLYLPHPGWYVPNNAAKDSPDLPPGWDVRGDGGYVMYPPSRTHKGIYRRTARRAPLQVDDVPGEVTHGGVTYRLRSALGLVRPVAAVKPQTTRPPADDQVQDGPAPVWLIVDRAAHYAVRSRNRGAFMFGVFMHANGYPESTALEEATAYVGEVAHLKREAFTVEEARKAIRSAYRYEAKEGWVRQEQ